MDELGHFSVRCPERDRVLMNGKISPGQVREEDIVLLDLDGQKIEGDREPADSVKGLRREEMADVPLLYGQRRNYRENVTEAIDNVNRRGNSEPDPEDPPFPEKTAAGHGKG